MTWTHWTAAPDPLSTVTEKRPMLSVTTWFGSSGIVVAHDESMELENRTVALSTPWLFATTRPNRRAADRAGGHAQSLVGQDDAISRTAKPVIRILGGRLR